MYPYNNDPATCIQNGAKETFMGKIGFSQREAGRTWQESVVG
jgi:hypothetical protein